MSPVASGMFGIFLYAVVNTMLNKWLMPNYQVPSVLLGLYLSMLPVVFGFYAYTRFGVVGNPTLYWGFFSLAILVAYLLLHEIVKRFAGADSPAPLPLGMMFVVLVVCGVLFLGGDNFYLDGLQRTADPVLLTILFTFMPVLVAVMTYLLERDLPTKWHVAGLVFAMLMTACLAMGNKEKAEKRAAAAAKIPDGVSQVVSASRVK